LDNYFVSCVEWPKAEPDFSNHSGRIKIYAGGKPEFIAVKWQTGYKDKKFRAEIEIRTMFG